MKFLARLERAFAKDLELHVVLDTYGTHNHPKVKAWLAKKWRCRRVDLASATSGVDHYTISHKESNS